ncbi:MAG: flagellar hook-associated protein FlgK [Rhizobiales bacterium]|nr:flagellar hook-associated protein FlgK [Hyphomicrobiales bacterium]
MGLTNILKTSNSGLSVTQASIDVVARNIANAGTDGYTRKVASQDNVVSGAQGLGARISGISREVNQYVQQQLFIEDSRLSYSQEISNYLNQIDNLFGAPGAANALDTRVNEFTQSLQDLSTQPESQAARLAAVNQAEALAGQLRNLTDGVQSLRQLTEDSLAEGINELNNLLQGLEEINGQIATASAAGVEIADLKDQRDLLINRVSEYLEVDVSETPVGTAVLYSKSGNVLVDNEAVQFTFDQNGSVNANALYSTDDAERGVGTVTLSGSNDYELDLIENGILDTGRLGALLELRDNILPQTQQQLDDLAHGLALSLSNNTVSGTAATVGAATGFDLDISDLQRGNVISLEYTDNTGPTTHNISIVRVDDPSVLPLDNSVTSNPNDTVIGVDFSAGEAAVAAALDAALGANITVSLPSAGTLRIVDDGATNNTDINALSATVTATSVQDQGFGFPLFIDTGNNQPYTGAVDGGYQKTGFAGRIVVNGAIKSDPTLLIKSTSSTAIGDNARPLDILARLEQGTSAFGGENGIGSEASPFVGTVINFAKNIISFQTSQSERANLNLTAQEAVTTSLREKYESDTGVNVDQELADLIALQQAFAANARVIAVTSELMDTLLQSV